jgi:hypothetical protein
VDVGALELENKVAVSLRTFWSELDAGCAGTLSLGDDQLVWEFNLDNSLLRTAIRAGCTLLP